VTDPGPLAGKTVVITRTVGHGTELLAVVGALDANVLDAPVLEVLDPSDWAPCDAAVTALATYDWIVFTSANAVDRFFDRARRVGRSAPAVLAAAHMGRGAGPRAAAIGAGTARKLSSHGVPVALTADTPRAEGLVAALGHVGAARPGRRVLLPRALGARETLPEALRAAGARVDVVPVYRTVATAYDATPVLRAAAAGRVDAVTITSGGAARALLGALDRAHEADPALGPFAPESLRVVVGGPITGAAVRALGFTRVKEAEAADTSSVVTALVAACEEEAAP